MKEKTEIVFIRFFFHIWAPKIKVLNFEFLQSDVIGRPDKPQCSSFNVASDEPSIDLPKLTAFDSDNGVPRVTNICNA